MGLRRENNKNRKYLDTRNMKAQRSVCGLPLKQRFLGRASCLRPELEEDDGLKSRDLHFHFRKVGKMEIKPSADKEIKIRRQGNEMRNENPNRDKETKSPFLEKNDI